MFKIALDAGHGMWTPGKRCLKSLDPNETREWYLNNRMCDLIEKKLTAYKGYELLRVDDTTGDIDVPLVRRTSMANAYGADFYLSVHHDAGVLGGTGGGITSIAHTGASERSLECQRIIYEAVVASTGLAGNRSVPLLRKNLHVLRETNMPAVLIECGFMDSATDVPVILSDEFAHQAADGLVSALVKIGGLELKDGAVQEGVSFVDIKGHYAEKAITELRDMGIVNGMDPEHYCPDEPIDRGDMAIIARNIIRYITGE